MTDESTLRAFIRECIIETAGWDDVSAIFDVDEDGRDDDEFDDVDITDVKDMSYDDRYRLNKAAKDALRFVDRDTYARVNTSLYSMKPISPRQHGAPASGRSVGGRTFGVDGRVYSSGY